MRNADTVHSPLGAPDNRHVNYYRANQCAIKPIHILIQPPKFVSIRLELKKKKKKSKLLSKTGGWPRTSVKETVNLHWLGMQ